MKKTKSSNWGGARPGAGPSPSRIVLSRQLTAHLVEAFGYKNTKELLRALDRGELVIALERVSKRERAKVPSHARSEPAKNEKSNLM